MVASFPRSIQIGSRKSQLALIQTHWVQGELSRAFPEDAFEVQTMETQGDKILEVPLSKIGDKGLFTQELEKKILDEEVDFAVHSLKDLPTRLPDGLMLGCVTERKDPADAVVFHKKHQGKDLASLPEGVVIGTSSLRRLAQLRHHYPHLKFEDIRGNLNTRLRKLDEGQYDAIILAVAGLVRMEISDRIHQVLPPDISLHAVGQGALGIECRSNDPSILNLIKTLEHTPTAQRCYAERAFLRELEGGCQVPIGVNTSIDGNTLTLVGLVASLDGQTLIKDTISGPVDTADQMGTTLAATLREQGAQEILDEIAAELRQG